MRIHVLIGLILSLLAVPPAVANDLDDRLVVGDVDGAFAHVADIESPAARVQAFGTLCRGLAALHDADPALAQRVVDLARTAFTAPEQQVPAFVMTARAAAALDSPEAATGLLRFLVKDARAIPAPAFRADVLGAFLEAQLDLDPEGAPATIEHIRTALAALDPEPRLDRSIGFMRMLHAAGRADDAAAVAADIAMVVAGLEPTELRISAAVKISEGLCDEEMHAFAEPLLPDASAAVESIGTPDQRVGALLKIAELQRRVGDHEGRRATLVRAAAGAGMISDSRVRLSALMQIADLQGDEDARWTLAAAATCARKLTPARDRLAVSLTIAEKQASAGDRDAAQGTMEQVDVLFGRLPFDEQSAARRAYLRAWAVAGDDARILAYLETYYIEDDVEFWGPVLSACLADDDLAGAVTAADYTRADTVVDSARVDRANEVIDRCLDRGQFTRALEMVERLATNNVLSVDDGSFHRRPMLIRIASAQHDAGRTGDARRTFARVRRMLLDGDDLLPPTSTWMDLCDAQVEANLDEDGAESLAVFYRSLDARHPNRFTAWARLAAARKLIDLSEQDGSLDAARTIAEPWLNAALADADADDFDDDADTLDLRLDVATLLAVLGNWERAESLLTTPDARLTVGERLVSRDRDDLAREWAGRFPSASLRDDAFFVVARAEAARGHADEIARTVGLLSDEVRGPVAQALGRETLFERYGTFSEQDAVVEALLPLMSNDGRMLHFRWRASIRASMADLDGARDELRRFDALAGATDQGPLLTGGTYVQMAVAHARLGSYYWTPDLRRAHHALVREAAAHLRTVRSADDRQRARLVGHWGTLAQAASALPDRAMLDLAYFRGRIETDAISDPDVRAQAEAAVAEITQQRLDAVATAENRGERSTR